MAPWVFGMNSMMFKLGLCAEGKWRKPRAFNYLAKVINGAEFKDGIEVESDNSGRRLTQWLKHQI